MTQSLKFTIQDNTPIGLCCDHAGFEMKQYLIGIFEENKIAYKDYGTFSEDSCDYPDFAHKLGNAIDQKECSKGIAICGSGNGISMALNKHQTVRCALCWNMELARLARAHNDANVLSLPGRFITNQDARGIVDVFFNTEFEGGRHQRRVDKIPCSK